METDADVLAQIVQLAGQINRHKNGQNVIHPAQTAPSRGRGDYLRGSSGWRGRGGYPSRSFTRGGRGGRPQTHRNRSLVLTGMSSPAETGGNSEETSVNSGWIAKNDRHLQLINTSVYEKESLARTKAIEETRSLKIRQRDGIEKAKLAKHLQRTNLPTHRSTTGNGIYEISVQGIPFQVTNNGSKLVKVPGEKRKVSTKRVFSSPFLGDLHAAKATPKIAVVGGVRFHRSKNGNLIRNGVVQANRYERPSDDPGSVARGYQNANNSYCRRSGTIKKVNEPCKVFATTGSCPKGPQCRYIHEPSKVALCKAFLWKGACPSGDSCDLSHDLTPERTLPCVHFARGMCSNPDCRYPHVRVSPAAPVCRAFAIYGYCDNGSSCEDRHSHECPDFSNTGKCSTKGCRLPHREKASVMRTNTAAAEDDNSDLSSDEDNEEIDSEDVDSDDLDEDFMTGDDDGKPDLEALQQDFVRFA